LKKKFLVNLVIVLVLNLLIKPFWIFGIERNVQNRTGAEEYGLYFSLLGLSMVLGILLDCGITNFNNRAVSRNTKRVAMYLLTLSGLKGILGVVFAVVVLCVGMVVGYDNRQMYILSMLIINQFLQSFILYLRSNISGMQFYLTDSILSVLDKCLMIILCSILLWGPYGQLFHIEWFVGAQTLSSLVTVLACIVIVLKYNPIRNKIDVSRWLPILKHSVPFALLVLLMSSYNRIDGVMLERMLPDGKTAAGIYAMGFRLLDASSMIGFLFAGLLLPMFSRMIRKREPLGALLRMSYSSILIISISLSSICWVFKNEIIQLLYPGAEEESAYVLAILMSGFIGITTTYIFGTLLTAAGKLKLLNSMAAACLLINVILNAILIPRLGAKGSAIASLCTQWISAIAQTWIAHKYLNTELHINDWLKWTTLGLSIFAFTYLMPNVLSNWLITSMLTCIFSVVMLFILKLFAIHDITSLAGMMKKK
jgi:O-antigen/teichoic acid export membrane protein